GRSRGGAASRAKGTRCVRQREAGGAAINCVSLDRSARIRRRREKEQTGSPGIVPLQKKDEIEGEFDRRNTYAKKLESVFTNIGGCRIAAWLLRNGGGAGQPGLAKQPRRPEPAAGPVRRQAQDSGRHASVPG